MKARARPRLSWPARLAVATVVWLAATLTFSARAFTDHVPIVPNPLVTSKPTFEVRCGAPFGAASVQLRSRPTEPEAAQSRPPCAKARQTRRLLLALDVALALAVVVVAAVGLVSAKRRRSAT